MNGYNINTEVLRHTVAPVSSGHNFIFSTFAAIDSTSFFVSSDATAANTSTPFPIDDIKWLSTVTEADVTRCRTAVELSAIYKILDEHAYYPSWWIWVPSQSEWNDSTSHEVVRIVESEPNLYDQNGSGKCDCAKLSKSLQEHRHRQRLASVVVRWINHRLPLLQLLQPGELL